MLFSHGVFSAAAKILIIPFENATGDNKNDALKTGIPEILSVCFANHSEQIILVDRSTLEASLSEQALSWEQYVAKNSIQAIGQTLTADYILRGSLTLEDQQPQVQALLFDVTTTALHRTIAGTVDLNNIVNSLCATIASPLITALHKPTAQPTNLAAEQQAPEPQQLLINGLNHYYNGEYARAFVPLLDLIKAYPDDADAHYWLAQSFYQAGLSEFAYIQFHGFINRFADNPRVSKVKTLLKELKSNKE
jgi:TolA-binding protein